jgi:hypothetical protein
VRAAGDEQIETAGLVAATGSFGNPYLPQLPGQERFGGRILHAAGFRSPKAFAGERVVVVGGGNSAVQIAFDLAEVATTTITSRSPLQFVDQRPGGRDIHHRLVAGFDDLPLEWLAPLLTSTLVLDPGTYSEALASGLLGRRPMFTAFDDDAYGPTGRGSGSTRSSSPPATAPTSATCSHSAPWRTACRSTSAASRARTLGWPTPGSSCSARSPPTRCAG